MARAPWMCDVCNLTPRNQETGFPFGGEGSGGFKALKKQFNREIEQTPKGWIASENEELQSQW